MFTANSKPEEFKKTVRCEYCLPFKLMQSIHDGHLCTLNGRKKHIQNIALYQSRNQHTNI